MAMKGEAVSMRIHHQHLPRSTSRQYGIFSSRVFRIGFILLGVLLLVDVLSTLFSNSLQGALTLPAWNTSALPAQSLSIALPNILAQDTFRRPNQLFWGTASDGQSWQEDARSSHVFAIVNHTGQILKGNGIYDAILGARSSDAEVVFSGSVSYFPPSKLGTVLRWTSANTWYEANFDGAHLVLLKKVAGIVTELNVVPFAAQAGRSYTLRFRMVGPMLAARIWLTGQVEPTSWMVMGRDTALASGHSGLRVFVQNGATATVTSFKVSVR